MVKTDDLLNVMSLFISQLAADTYVKHSDCVILI